MKRLLTPLVVLQVLVLSACSTDRGVELLASPLAQTPLLDALLSPDKLSPDTKAVLKEQDLAATYRKDPATAIRLLHERAGKLPSDVHRLALIELCSDTGDRVAEENSREAAGYYLAAAELGFEGGTRPARSAPRRAEHLAAYNHSVGQLAHLLKESGHRWDETVGIEGPWRSYRLRCRTRGAGVLDPNFVDTLVSADYLKFKDIKLERIRVEGVGAAMVGHRAGTPERREANPFLPMVGMSLPVNATVEFSGGRGDAALTLHDLTLVDTVKIAGRTRTLAADRTAPLAILYNYTMDHNVGWKGLRHPEEYLDRMGLFQVEPFRPDQIPVIFVHGLMSSPETWLDALNLLRTDLVLRDRYQLLVFRYPTGFPIAYNSAALRRRLHEFQRHFDASRRNPRMREMILVGHSMGGILSNAQIRGSGDAFTRKMFTRPIDELGNVSDEQKAALKELLIYKANPDITRAVFVAAPHRGSKIAATPIGTLGTKLIKFPFQLLTSQPLDPVEGMTPLGQHVVTHRPDSVWGLKPDSPGLTAILENPVRKGVRYHSVIGRRKMSGPLQESGDGAVPYWSSHLPGAQSEKVVHAIHTKITHDPIAIEEVRRILYLHAGLPYTPSR